MKTYLGEVKFSDRDVPSISEVLEETRKYTDLQLDYVENHSNQYCVRFIESPSWCSEIKFKQTSIQIGDKSGVYEGPAVSQLILYTLKSMGGTGPSNDLALSFPLSFKELKMYEEKYIHNRPVVPRAIKHLFIGGFVLVGVFIYFLFYGA